MKTTDTYTFSSLFEHDEVHPSSSHPALSLRDAMRLVRGVIVEHFEDNPFWVRAELTSLHENASKGHLYMELVEKDGEQIVASVRANAWSQTGRRLKEKFERLTGTPLRSGIKVLLLCEVTFSEQYGLSFRVGDIDPSYTLGDMERQRREIIDRLTLDGVIDLNKQLPFPSRPHCVAVISSGVAAGYEDFLTQTRHNAYGVVILSKLYSALMQGEQTGASVIAALRRIDQDIRTHGVPYDAVVIIRGGGSSLDLSWFDNYPLASEVAQFPLPVVVGIGHTRDKGVLDMVANRSVKTPTECGEMLVRQLASALDDVDARCQDLKDAWLSHVASRTTRITLMTSSLRMATTGRIQKRLERIEGLRRDAMQIVQDRLARERLRQRSFAGDIRACILGQKERRLSFLRQYQNEIEKTYQQFRLRQEHSLQLMEERLRLLNPLSMLSRGYALVTKDGKRISDVSSVKADDNIVLRFKDGKVSARVNDVERDGENG